MSTAVGILDRDDWRTQTDNLAVVDPALRRVLSVPRDLWCESLRDRVNVAFSRGGHGLLKAALAELGHPVDHAVCFRRAAVERALAGVTITVPVPRRLEFRYPLEPTAPIEDGAKRITFESPEEALTGERIHQWIGARRGVQGYGGGDLSRIARQQVLVRRLLEEHFRFERFLADPTLVSVSDSRALEDLALVRAGWRFEVLSDVCGVEIDGKKVLRLRRRAVLTGTRRWVGWMLGVRSRPRAHP